MSLVDAILDGVGNFFGVILTALGGALSGAVIGTYRRSKKNKQRSQENKDRVDSVENDVEDLDERVTDNEEDIERQRRYLIGDEDDPAAPGVLEELHEVKQDVSELDDKMDRNHHELRERLTEIDDAVNGDE